MRVAEVVLLNAATVYHHDPNKNWNIGVWNK